MQIVKSNSIPDSRVTQVPVQLWSELQSSLFRSYSKLDWLVRLATVVIPTVFLSVVIMQPWVEPKWMFLDPLTAAELSGDCCHTHFGFVSMLGVMLWVSIASAALFAAVQLLAPGKNRPALRFAISALFLNGWLALDDAFLVHETVMPSLGVPQNLVLAIYVIMMITYLALNFRIFLKGDIWLLIVGAAGLAISLGVDTVFHSLDPRLVLLEDSAKFFGIFTWAVFHISTLIKVTIEPDPTEKSGT